MPSSSSSPPASPMGLKEEILANEPSQIESIIFYTKKTDRPLVNKFEMKNIKKGDQDCYLKGSCNFQGNKYDVCLVGNNNKTTVEMENPRNGEISFIPGEIKINMKRSRSSSRSRSNSRDREMRRQRGYIRSRSRDRDRRRGRSRGGKTKKK